MMAKVQHIELKQRYSLFLGMALFIHVLVFIFVAAPANLSSNFFKNNSPRKPIQIVRFGTPDSKIHTRNFVDYEKPQFKPMGAPVEQRKGKPLSFEDFKVEPEKVTTFPRKPIEQPTTRPGTLPKVDTAINGITFENKELKKLAQESMGGAQNILAGEKISLRYEVPNGKKLDELNEAELRLYGFLKRGAKNYTTSIMAELHDFELKYPHLQFPLTETKQVMTGRLTYDEKGNLKQIKMIRWTNIDKLQGFFENVLKRMEVMQNPPKELWAENGEFTVFITLQING